MFPSGRASWGVRIATFALWALAAASAVFWGLKLAGPQGGPATAPLAMRSAPPPDPMAIARLLGTSPVATAAAAPVPTLASRFNLVGVVADKAQTGAALIAVDGKPARPFRVGAAVDEGLVLQSVQGRKAVLAASRNGPAVLTLELPPLPRS
jgi:general secretion pathway protein C